MKEDKNKLQAKTCKIGWRVFDIVLENQVVGDDLTGLYGEIRQAQNKIRISSNYCIEQQKATLLHEILHGVNSEFMNDVLTEENITTMANGLYTVMVDNPQLFKEMIGGHNGV